MKLTLSDTTSLTLSTSPPSTPLTREADVPWYAAVVAQGVALGHSYIKVEKAMHQAMQAGGDINRGDMLQAVVQHIEGANASAPPKKPFCTIKEADELEQVLESSMEDWEPSEWRSLLLEWVYLMTQGPTYRRGTVCIEFREVFLHSRALEEVLLAAFRHTSCDIWDSLEALLQQSLWLPEKDVRKLTARLLLKRPLVLRCLQEAQGEEDTKAVMKMVRSLVDSVCLFKEPPRASQLQQQIKALSREGKDAMRGTHPTTGLTNSLVDVANKQRALIDEYLRTIPDNEAIQASFDHIASTLHSLEQRVSGNKNKVERWKHELAEEHRRQEEQQRHDEVEVSRQLAGLAEELQMVKHERERLRRRLHELDEYEREAEEKIATAQQYLAESKKEASQVLRQYYEKLEGLNGLAHKGDRWSDRLGEVCRFVTKSHAWAKKQVKRLEDRMQGPWKDYFTFLHAHIALCNTEVGVQAAKVTTNLDCLTRESHALESSADVDEVNECRRKIMECREMLEEAAAATNTCMGSVDCVVRELRDIEGSKGFPPDLASITCRIIKDVKQIEMNHKKIKELLLHVQATPITASRSSPSLHLAKRGVSPSTTISEPVSHQRLQFFDTSESAISLEDATFEDEKSTTSSIPPFART